MPSGELSRLGGAGLFGVLEGRCSVSVSEILAAAVGVIAGGVAIEMGVSGSVVGRAAVGVVATGAAAGDGTAAVVAGNDRLAVEDRASGGAVRRALRGGIGVLGVTGVFPMLGRTGVI